MVDSLITAILRTLPVFAATWFVWCFLRRLFVKHPLADIVGPPSDSWAAGSLLSIIGPDAWSYHDKLIKKFGKTFRFTGMMQEQALYTFDPKAMHHIFVKDQHLFPETDEFIRGMYQLLGPAMTAVGAADHSRHRRLLTPVFSVAHLREIVPVFFGLQSALAQKVSRGENEVDLAEWMTRTALELIGQSGFAFSFDSLEFDGPQHPYGPTIKQLLASINDSLILSFRILVVPWVENIGTPAFQRKVINALPWPMLHAIRDMVDMMWDTSKGIIEEMERALQSGDDLSNRIAGGKDIMSILVRDNMSAPEKDRLSRDEIIAQVSFLTFAATDTTSKEKWSPIQIKQNGLQTSNALSRIFHLLSENLEVQEKVRDEIAAAFVQNSGDLGYDALMGLPFLDAVCKETLRLHAPIPFVMRQAAEDTMLSLSEPVKCFKGEKKQEIMVPKGTRIFISILNSNRDPNVWGPDAAEWKPERWMNPLPDTVLNAKVPGVYSHMMTFIGGGRSCIGFKFSQLEMKVILSLMLQTFKIEPSGKKIEWQFNAVAHPTTEDAPVAAAGKKVQLPMKLTLL
ncbi:cytochrome P450 [Ephemerocybe angulata]|uniref:Cytochrome P450 n=1 Tax=Ephemerocybe angulata TaxID=980116 RepID=A0A8H6HSW9_9AGAR|nr:cytochrome P450 [Tulosesus angulatus]